MRIQKFVACFLLGCLVVSTLSAQELKRVLFIGNSYTYVNDLPGVFSELSSSVGRHADCEMIAGGGMRFMQHASSGEVLTALQTGQWDYVVLQGQSQEGAFPDGQFMQEVYPYARTLDSLAKVYNSDTEVLFFMTWGYRYGDPMNCPYYDAFCTFESMSLRLRENYCMMARDFSSSVVPVGVAWLRSVQQDSTVVLHSSDNSHPSLNGTYLAACCFYGLVFGEEIHTDYLLQGMNGQDAVYLQDVANRAVVDSLNWWRTQDASLDRNETMDDCSEMNFRTIVQDGVVKVELNGLESEATVCLYDVTGRQIDVRTTTNCPNAAIFLSTKGRKGCFVVNVLYEGRRYGRKTVVI